MIVVDTNVLAYLTIPGERNELARRALTLAPDWAAPGLWRSEMRCLLLRHVRLGRLSAERACAMMQFAEELLDGREYAVRSPDVLELALQSGCTAYDCEFVAVARQLGVPLVTCDRQIIQAFPTRAFSLEQFVGR